MRHLFIIAPFMFCLFLCLSPAVYSDSSSLRQLDTDQMIKGLMLKPPGKPKSVDRGWQTNDRGVKVEGVEEVLPPETSSIDLAINFEYNSAQLTTDAKLNLKKLATALNSNELSGQRFKITGHTDSVGGENYNFKLSERRAFSVQDYLIENHVSTERLEAQGRGYSELADSKNPTNAINRRVQITNLGG